MKQLLIILISIIILGGCEEQPIPIPQAPVSNTGRVILIEDYTGVNCVPCFGANVVLDAAVDASPDGIVVYGAHGSLQSEPVDGSKYDFRYPDAADLEASADLIGKPAAAFNRILLPSGRRVQLGSGSWQPFIDKELAKPQVVQLGMLTEYDADNRRVDIDLSVIPLETISGNTNVHIVISESNLIDSQASPSGIIPDYKHKHVMKASLTGLQGDPLASDLDPDQIYREKYSYTLPAESNGEWIAENMEVTAFITSDDLEGEVLQALQLPFVQ